MSVICCTVAAYVFLFLSCPFGLVSFLRSGFRSFSRPAPFSRHHDHDLLHHLNVAIILDPSCWPIQLLRHQTMMHRPSCDSLLSCFFPGSLFCLVVVCSQRRHDDRSEIKCFLSPRLLFLSIDCLALFFCLRFVPTLLSLVLCSISMMNLCRRNGVHVSLSLPLTPWSRCPPPSSSSIRRFIVFCSKVQRRPFLLPFFVSLFALVHMPCTGDDDDDDDGSRGEKRAKTSDFLPLASVTKSVCHVILLSSSLSSCRSRVLPLLPSMQAVIAAQRRTSHAAPYLTSACMPHADDQFSCSFFCPFSFELMFLLLSACRIIVLQIFFPLLLLSFFSRPTILPVCASCSFCSLPFPLFALLQPASGTGSTHEDIYLTGWRSKGGNMPLSLEAEGSPRFLMFVDSEQDSLFCSNSIAAPPKTTGTSCG